jgi:hypothetical protein
MRSTILVSLIIIVFIAGCTRDKAIDSTCQGCAATVSFRSDIIPIFRANCALSGCHTGPTATAQGHVSLDSALAYTVVTEPGKGYVVASNPGYSILYSQLLVGSNNHMPLTGQLSDCDIQKIFCWIQQGAQNN